MNGTYSPDVDMAYIALKDIGQGESVKQKEIETKECHLVLDLDIDNRLIGIEVFRAGTTLHEDTIKQLVVYK